MSKDRLKIDIRKALLKSIQDGEITKADFREAINMVRELARVADLSPLGAIPGEEFVTGYMCLTDFQCELGMASDGNKVFPSVESLKDHKPCAEACGIVEVRVFGTKVVQLPNDDAKITVTVEPISDQEVSDAN